MLIPLTTGRPQRRAPIVTWALVALNVVLYIMGTALQRQDRDAFDRLERKAVLDPLAIGMGGERGDLYRQLDVQQQRLIDEDLNDPDGALSRTMERMKATLAGDPSSIQRPDNWGWWSLLSYQFLHGGFWHVLGNMLFLWVFGPPVEDRFGRIGFLAFYLLGGVLAGLTHAAFEVNPVVGASGSISAVTGAFLVLFPRVRIRVFSLFVILGVFELPAWILIAFAVVRDLFGIGMGSEGVAYLAHLGGYVMGFTLAMGLLLSKVLPEEDWSLLVAVQQQKRRAVFKSQIGAAEKEWKRRSGRVETPPGAGPTRERGVEERLLWQRVDSDASNAETRGDDPALISARARVSAALARGDAGQQDAVEAYRSVRRLSKERGGKVLPLPRRQLMEVANLLMAGGHYGEAADAYELCISTSMMGDGRGGGQPLSPTESARTRLMVALLSARYLNDPARARTALAGIASNGGFSDPDLDGLLSTLRLEVGDDPPASVAK